MDRPKQSFASIWDGLRFQATTVYYHGGLLAFGLLLVLPLLGAGKGIGLPHLYWQDSVFNQASVGLAFGLVYWHLGFVAYFLAVANPEVVPYDPEDRKEAVRYVHKGRVPVLVVLLALAVILGEVLDTFAPEPWPPHLGAPMLGGLLISYGFMELTLIAITDEAVIDRCTRWSDKVVAIATAMAGRIDRVLERIGFRPKPIAGHLAGFDRGETDAYRYRRALLGLMVMFTLLLLLFWLGMSTLADTKLFTYLPVAVSYCAMLGFFSSAYGALRLLARRLTLPVLVGVLGFLVQQWACYPGGTAMRSNCEAADDPAACEDSWSAARRLSDPAPAEPATELVDDAAALEAVVGDAGGPVVVITTSGGGIRSAAWTVAVFAQLVARDAEFFSHVRLITGSSGGMVGAAHWVGERVAGSDDVTAIYCQSAASSLYAPLGNMALVTPRIDRGEALERAWEVQSRSLAQPLSGLRALEQTGEIPSLVFTPMVVEDGSQMLVTNLDLGWYALADRALDQGSDPPSCAVGSEPPPPEGSCSNARQLFARVPSQTVKISTIARLNASFPYVTPAAILPFDEHPRVVDAGYYDNYGIKLATAWIYHHAQGCSSADRAGCRLPGPILLIELRDHSITPSVAEPAWRPLLHELTSPLEALASARLHVAGHRNAATIDTLARELDVELEHIVFHYDGQASLSWELNAGERRDIWSEAADEGSWARLDAWLDEHVPSAAGVELGRPSCIPGE